MNRRVALLTISLVVASCSRAKTEPSPSSETPAQGTAIGPPPSMPSGTISGVVDVADSVRQDVVAGDTIYLMARNAVTGSLIAVTRLTAPAEFPVPFRLTGRNVMHNQATLVGRVRLEVRVDKDGDAMTKEPGDVVGESTDLVQVPTEGFKLILTRKL